IHVIRVVLTEVPIVPVDPLVAPVVGVVYVISPTGVLNLVYYSSSSNSDPSEDSLPIALELPLVSPFLCINDLGADSESEPAEQRPERHESLAPSSEFPLAHVVALPEIHRQLTILFIDSSSDISSGSSSDSLSDSSLVHSSGCDASGQSHLGPSTRVASPRDADPLLLWYHHLLLFQDRFVDLLPCKRFRDSYSSKVSGKEHMEIGTADEETITDLGISDGVGAPTEDGIGMGVKVATSDIKEDEEEFEAEANAGGTIEIILDLLVTGGISEPTRGDALDLEGTLYDIAHYLSEVPLDRITEFETTQRQLEAEHVLLTMNNTRSGMTHAAIKEMINQCVSEASETREANRNIRLGNSNDEGSNRNEGGNENGNHNENDRDVRPVVREYTYQDFMKCQPLNFKGAKGVVRLIRWFEKMEIVFHISNYPEKYQVKYATCTLLNNALTW
ncbi:hypothetical protein Tco_0552070, partial [Tanacetum coccineum]